MNIEKESLPSFMAGNGSVDESAIQLSEIAYPVLKHVVVRADADNGSTITVGASEAEAANGFILAAGEQTPPIYIDDVSKVWVIGGAADQLYNWVAN